MAIQKKNAKARLDKYYYLAKEKGYRARAAFKLIQLNKKYSFLQNSRCLLDLCAAPGSWMQVAAETMPVKSLIVGVDLAPIKPIPRTISFQDDITSDKCRATIRGHLKSWKADTVVHDGAPNVGTAWVQDAFSQNELVLASLKLATEFLAPDGTFVTKVFRSKDSAKLEWIFKQLFSKVEQTKPPSSRNVSAETFYVCRGFKAPKHMDPRFLDPKHAFAEVEAAAVNNEAKVFNPEKKKRKREGYEEGDWTQFHEAPASEFIQTQDPIEMLGNLNRLHFRQENNGDIALAALDKLPETTEEIRECCSDLKVLGRKEFKLLLRWRLKARERFGFRQKKTDHVGASAEQKAAADDVAVEGAAGEEVAMVEPMDEEMKLQEDLQRMKDMQSKTERKKRKKDNERKQKEIVRMQMNMVTPSDIGIEAGGPEGSDATFRLKDVDKDGGVRKQIVRGRMVANPVPEVKKAEEESEEEAEDDDGDELERQLDGMYEDYQDRLEQRSTKIAAKRARMKARGDEDDEFEGFDKDDKGADTDVSSDADLMEDEDDGFESEGEQAEIMTGPQPRDREGALSGRAASFFQQDIFKDIPGLEDAEESEAEQERDSGIDVASGSLSPELKAASKGDNADQVMEVVADDNVEDESEIEEVATKQDDAEDWEEGTSRPTEQETGRPNIDIITAEAMTLAHALATGKTTKAQLADDNFNKFSHRDVDGLPEWFLDDENKHSRPQRPITAEAAKAIKEKLRALNARPIKKVREAKARKTFRAARRLEKLKKKSDGLAEGSELSEKEKAASIAGLMAKAKKAGQKKRKQVKVIKAVGANKGSGRPRGVKGKYKMVDSRLKKDVRGEKRAAKKMKGKR
ncbi:AdoMet-dependent rRNA methyltransferase spb1 [Saxophila tyrrhenica]|uniref:AdoMet-dependent rRNA methyltransferase spb1 n=1 Tax=Saxophila tyrrhenica TaxID=1690608 RepID=A0AAV9P4M4_9PEZI|nr:AdoMet-dependent rRNA methyltransferase spb1 [Saxophila tyrrhenica]